MIIPTSDSIMKKHNKTVTRLQDAATAHRQLATGYDQKHTRIYAAARKRDSLIQRFAQWIKDHYDHRMKVALSKKYDAKKEADKCEAYAQALKVDIKV